MYVSLVNKSGPMLLNVRNQVRSDIQYHNQREWIQGSDFNEIDYNNTIVISLAKEPLN